jgi:dolichyl-phosphate-mannose--protein O-mannosyl transferase
VLHGDWENVNETAELVLVAAVTECCVLLYLWLSMFAMGHVLHVKAVKLNKLYDTKR